MAFRYFLIISLFVIPLQVNAESDDYQVWQEQVLNEFFYQESSQFAYRRLSEGEERTLLNKRAEEAESKITDGNKSPVLHFIRGILGHSKQVFYHLDLMAVGKPYRLNAPENQALIKEYQFYYRKALDLDEAIDAPEHLTVEMLGTIADDILAAPDIKERAYRKAIALAQSGKANVPDGYEYTTYQFLLESYSAQKNPEKYLATLNEMIDRFGSTEELEGYKHHVEEVLKKKAVQENK